MVDENLNVLWARAFVEELVRSGVRHAVVCPGSRSSPLAIACARSEGLRVWSVVDERTAAFFALGLSRQGRVPALVLATSGTAGAHFFPALLEAEASATPLLAVTADRPPELHGWGAHQTMSQTNLFGAHVRAFVDLGTPVASDPALLHLRATANRVVAQARGPLPGPVHVNAPFREPLAPTSQNDGLDMLSELARAGRGPAPFVELGVSAVRADDARVQRVAERVGRCERGVIVCGPRQRNDRLRDAVAQLARATGFPILAEAASQVRFARAERPIIAHYDTLLRHEPFAKAARPELVLRFGASVTSKVLQAWLDGSGAEQIVVSDDGLLFDASHSAGAVLQLDAVEACRALSAKVLRTAGPYARMFEEAERLARLELERALGDEAPLSEPGVARAVGTGVPEGTALFVSSSMPVRDLDAFASPNGRELVVHCNRGVNGIDGVTSTALGVAAASGQPVVLLTGDLAFLHDLGAWAIARQHGIPLTAVVVNNDGGGIFSFLPIAQATEHFEPLFGTPHGLTFEGAAQLFGAKHEVITSAPALRAALRAASPELRILEVRTDRATNVERHRALNARVAAALGEGPWA
jgi:2-succinyl-5-enolpyruvyl-6-hydroxy-3-cyclohexene-1-carboxylate synthase